MPDTAADIPWIYGTLIVHDSATAHAALRVLGAPAPATATSLDDLGERISVEIDKLFPPGPNAGAPAQTPSEVYPYGAGGLPSGVTVQVNTRPEDWDAKEHLENIKAVLDGLAKESVSGYMEVYYQGGYRVERSVHVLTPQGVHIESAATLLD